MKLLRPTQPLYLPRGSVRSIIALSLCVAYIFAEIPIEVVTLVLGFYFGERGSNESG